MENTLDPVKSLFEKLKEYSKTSFELYKLKTVSKTAKIVSTLVSRLASFLVLFMFLVFASVGLALWIGDLLDKPYLGFLSVAAFYILLGVVLYFFLHNFIKQKVSDSIISEILNKKNEPNK